jgi:hypothetical protein
MSKEGDSLIVRTHVVDPAQWLARVDREGRQTVVWLELHNMHAEAETAWRAHLQRTADCRRLVTHRTDRPAA